MPKDNLAHDLLYSTSLLWIGTHPCRRLRGRCGSSQEILFIVLPVSQAPCCVQVGAKYSFSLIGWKASFSVSDIDEPEQKVRKQSLREKIVDKAIKKEKFLQHIVKNLLVIVIKIRLLVYVFILCARACMCLGALAVRTQKWKSEDNFWKSVLSIHLWVLEIEVLS